MNTTSSKKGVLWNTTDEVNSYTSDTLILNGNSDSAGTIQIPVNDTLKIKKLRSTDGTNIIDCTGTTLSGVTVPSTSIPNPLALTSANLTLGADTFTSFNAWTSDSTNYYNGLSIGKNVNNSAGIRWIQGNTALNRGTFIGSSWFMTNENSGIFFDDTSPGQNIHIKTSGTGTINLTGIVKPSVSTGTIASGGYLGIDSSGNMVKSAISSLTVPLTGVTTTNTAYVPYSNGTNLTESSSLQFSTSTGLTVSSSGDATHGFYIPSASTGNYARIVLGKTLNSSAYFQYVDHATAANISTLFGLYNSGIGAAETGITFTGFQSKLPGAGNTVNTFYQASLDPSYSTMIKLGASANNCLAVSFNMETLGIDCYTKLVHRAAMVDGVSMKLGAKKFELSTPETDTMVHTLLAPSLGANKAIGFLVGTSATVGAVIQYDSTAGTSLFYHYGGAFLSLTSSTATLDASGMITLDSGTGQYQFVGMDAYGSVGTEKEMRYDTADGTLKYIPSKRSLKVEMIPKEEQTKFYEDLDKLETKYYRMKKGVDMTHGMYAEDLDKNPSWRIFCCYEDKDRKIPDSIKYSELTIGLIDCVKEQKKQIKYLKERQTELENINFELEKRLIEVEKATKKMNSVLDILKSIPEGGGTMKRNPTVDISIPSKSVI